MAIQDEHAVALSLSAERQLEQHSAYFDYTGSSGPVGATDYLQSAEVLVVSAVPRWTGLSVFFSNGLTRQLCQGVSRRTDCEGDVLFMRARC
jgi:hypothetical protein